MNIDSIVLQAFESIRTPALTPFYWSHSLEAAILIPALCIITGVSTKAGFSGA